MPTSPTLRRGLALGAAIAGLAIAPTAAPADDAVAPCDPAAPGCVVTVPAEQPAPTPPAAPAVPPAPAVTPAVLPALPPVPAPAATAAANHKAKRNSGCADQNLMPSAANLARIRHATLCLLNRQRRAHHRRALRSNTTLQGVAQAYTHLMVSERFFDHVSPSGSTFIQRIRRTDYLAHAASWSLGENLAWGSGFYATPKETVSAWMHSPGHRHNILEPRYREIGIGIEPAAPMDTGGVPGATYATEFGKRTR